jgi:hypothetical protein
MVTIPGMESINYWGIFEVTARWTLYIIGGLMVAGIAYIGLYLVSFPIKCKYWPVYGSGKDGVLTPGKMKNNRFKKNKDGTAWIALYPIFKGKEIEPFDSEYIYPGNQVYAFYFNDVYHPGRIDVADEDKMRGTMRAVPHSARAWQSLQHKKNAIEYASGVFDRNKMFIMTILTVLILCVLVGFTLWSVFEFVSPAREDIQGLTRALNNVVDANIPSK